MSKYGEPWTIKDMHKKFSASARDRIILCVNACAGIPDEEFKTLNFLGLGLKERISLLYQQIDKLLVENAKLKGEGK